MAKNTAAVLDEELDVDEAAEPTTRQLINEQITRFLAEKGLEGQKARYKSMRAIAFQAFSEALDDGTFSDLVDRAIANADELPAGWKITDRESTAKPAAKPAAKRTVAKKAAAKPAAKSSARPRRRVRSAA